MKKFAAAMSVTLMSGGIAIAGGCDYHNESHTMAKNATEAPQKPSFFLWMASEL